MSVKNRVLLASFGWLALISVLHARLNVNWASIVNDYLPEEKRRFNVAYIPVTCHLACPVTDFISKYSKAGQIFLPRMFQGFPEIKEALISNNMQAAFIVAPLAIALKAQGVPIKIVYLGHRYGSAVVVHKDGPVKTFLDLARLESGRVQFRKTAFSLADLLYECKDVMASKADEEHIQVRVESPEGLPVLEADRDKLKQVLLNLLSNAIKYNRPNGSVILRAEAAETEVFISVQDTGLGIPEPAIPHLFEKFYRVREHEGKASGTGLGLSISKQIIQGHGGRIEVKSKMGIGTMFMIHLPRGGSKTQPHKS